MKIAITEMCSVIRSKQAGPFRLTLDLVFRDQESYERAKQAAAISKETVAALLVEAKAQNRPFDLNDVSDICTLVQSNIEKNHVNFTREIDIIEAQPISSTLVRQVIINLLLNAFQATQPHGHVHLHIYRDSEHLFIDVINDGSYIPQDQVSYLFEPFTSLKEGGSGLGLWVIYQVVQQLGGLITVQSEPDKTQFSVQLPLEKPPE